MFEKIKEEIKQPYYANNYPNDGQRFVAWYLRNIHLRDMNETKADVTDGADDKQIDAIFVDDDNSTVYVIKGKFVGVDSIDAEPLREVLSAWIQLKDIVRLQETANSKLKQRLAEVGLALDNEYDVAFELITTGTLTDAARDHLATFQAQLARADDLPASIHVIDEDELKRRYELALDRENPLISHTLNLQAGKYLSVDLGGTKVVLVALSLKDCLTFPGIKDGTLFQKNVRQSLGLNNVVNKGIKHTIYNNSRDFFFSHNGITAICNQMGLAEDGTLRVKGVSVVNGCQSLNTILSCSEKVRALDNAFVMFRFYEILRPSTCLGRGHLSRSGRQVTCLVRRRIHPPNHPTQNHDGAGSNPGLDRGGDPGRLRSRSALFRSETQVKTWPCRYSFTKTRTLPSASPTTG
jgi:hypothetical protein